MKKCFGQWWWWMHLIHMSGLVKRNMGIDTVWEKPLWEKHWGKQSCNAVLVFVLRTFRSCSVFGFLRLLGSLVYLWYQLQPGKGCDVNPWDSLFWGVALAKLYPWERYCTSNWKSKGTPCNGWCVAKSDCSPWPPGAHWSIEVCLASNAHGAADVQYPCNFLVWWGGFAIRGFTCWEPRTWETHLCHPHDSSKTTCTWAAEKIQEFAGTCSGTLRWYVSRISLVHNKLLWFCWRSFERFGTSFLIVYIWHCWMFLCMLIFERMCLYSGLLRQKQCVCGCTCFFECIGVFVWECWEKHVWEEHVWLDQIPLNAFKGINSKGRSRYKF